MKLNQMQCFWHQTGPSSFDASCIKPSLLVRSGRYYGARKQLKLHFACLARSWTSEKRSVSEGTNPDGYEGYLRPLNQPSSMHLSLQRQQQRESLQHDETWSEPCAYGSKEPRQWTHLPSTEPLMSQPGSVYQRCQQQLLCSHQFGTFCEI